MPAAGRHQTRNEIDIAAPADVVFGVIADPVRWPHLFAPTVHVERAALPAGRERLRIWATGNGEVRGWTSLRTVEPDRHTVTFRQEVSAPPVASMGGTWSIADAGDGRVRLTLDHDFEAVGDDPGGVAWIRRATDENSRLELGNIKRIAESWDRLGALVLSFEDAVHIDAGPEAVYGFLRDAGAWPERLPHVSAMEFAETPDGVQTMTMHTTAKDGSAHVTKSVRVCFPTERIVYKQIVTPPLIAAHVGAWELEQSATGVEVRSRHTVTLNEEALDPAPGSLATARSAVRDAIGGNSRATLALAKEFAETVTHRVP